MRTRLYLFRTAQIVKAVLVTATLSVSLLGASWAQDPWPRQMTKPGGKLILYQPQVDEWKNYKEVDARMAFLITPTGGKSHVGVVTVSLTSDADMDARTVFLSNPQITSISFPSLDPAASAKMDQLVRTFLNPSATMTISLDRLVASVQKRHTPQLASVKNDPPTIFVSMRPAILLLVNGAPTMAPIASSSLEFVVNANWPVFHKKDGSTYYLFDGKGWMAAPNLQDKWSPTNQLPSDMAKALQNPNFADLKGFIPPPPGSAATFPMVYFSNTPAEIIVFSGQPQWTAIPGTQLMAATNTDSPVFKYIPTGAFYFLTSGRWFTTTTPILGGWTFATYNLPPDFAKIPPSSPAGAILSSVPGTPEAEDAVLIAQIPTTAIVNPAKAAAEAQVSYVGEPQFQPIPGTTMFYATNTPNKVIQVGAQYYLCYQAVWFVSATAQGPWQVAQNVPQVIYTIPPSSPVYNVTYVTQVSMSDGNVQSSYTAGYMGAFIVGATVGAIVASGTGYYYPPYIYHGYYYPYAATYGYHTYNPYTGAYGYGGAAYGPYGSAHWGTSYNPNTGTYARGATASTAYGTRSAGQAYNPYTGAYAATRQGSNAYGSWGQSVVSKNGNTAYTQHASNAYGSAGSIQTSNGGRAAGTSTAYGNTAVGKTSNGDMYAGHDGNVYKNTGSGWQTYNNGSWNDVQKPASQNYNSTSNYSSAQQKAQSYQQQHPSNTSGYNKPSGSSGSYDTSGAGSSYGDLNQEAQNRQRGAEQSQRYSQSQHSGWGGGGWDRSWGGGGGDRSWGGGGDRSWGGGGRSWGGGGRR